jgi:hypothetical protein
MSKRTIDDGGTNAYILPMVLTVDPCRFISKPLFLRLAIIGNATAPDDYIAVCDDLTVARIMRVEKSFGRHSWDWHITGPYVPPEMGGRNGQATSLDEAKTCVRATFERWLAWSTAQGGDVHWTG